MTVFLGAGKVRAVGQVAAGEVRKVQRTLLASFTQTEGRRVRFVSDSALSVTQFIFHIQRRNTYESTHFVGIESLMGSNLQCAVECLRYSYGAASC